MSSEQPNVSLKELLANNRGAAVVAALMVIGFVVMFAIVLTLLLRDSAGEGDATPTPFADSALDRANEPLVVGISDSDTISVTLDTPAALQMGGRSFAVQSQVVKEDRVWSPTFEEPDTAVWIYGTIINYVIGLPDTEENRAMLEQLTPSDQMMLTTRNGAALTFAFNSREQILVGNPDVYAQHTPGLTLILVGSEGEERLVVNGRYIVDESGGGSQGNQVELGETAQLDNLQITVTGAVYLLDRPEAQPGFAFYLVDYQIQNSGLTALDTSKLHMTLHDEAGNQYAISPAAGQLGSYPALSGFLNAGQAAQATAGYQIPLGLNSANVLWSVTHETSGSQLQVTIPFSGGSQAYQNAQATLTNAAVSLDLTSLILTGKITNPGDQPIVVSEKDLSLQTGDGSVYLLLSTNPAFPWTIAPGQSVQYMVTFQRPVITDTAIFTVLNQPFQLNNLR